MKYRFHEGIVYTRICNVHVLVATRSVWDQFPSVREVSPLQGCFCQGIDEGMEEDELIDAREQAIEEMEDRRYLLLLYI